MYFSFKKKKPKRNERSFPKAGYTNVKIGHHISNQEPWDNSVL